MTRCYFFNSPLFGPTQKKRVCCIYRTCLYLNPGATGVQYVYIGINNVRFSHRSTRTSSVETFYFCDLKVLCQQRPGTRDSGRDFLFAQSMMVTHFVFWRIQFADADADGDTEMD